MDIQDNIGCYIKFDFENGRKTNVSDINELAGKTCSSTLSGIWDGIYKMNGTFCVEVKPLSNSIQPALRCRDKGKWNNTHSYAKNNKSYAAIVLENLVKNTGRFKVECTKSNGKSKEQ